VADTIQLLVELDDRGTPKVRILSNELPKLGDESERASKKWRRSFSDMSGATDSLIGKLKRFSMSLPGLFGVATGAGVAAGLAAAVKSGVALSGRMETLQTQFRVIQGDATKAKKTFQEIVEFSASTPFQMPQVAAAAKTLLAFGLEGTENLRMGGDAAAAAGRPIEEMAMIFGRIKSGNFGEAFMRLAETGVATRQMLEAQGLKFDRAGSYKGSVDDAMAAVAEIVRTRFGGMMEEVSKTWEGTVSNFQDNWGLFLAGVAEPIKETLQPVLKGLSDWFGRLISSGAARQIGEGLAEGIQIAITGVARFIHLVQNIEPYARYGVYQVLGVYYGFMGGVKEVVKSIFANWEELAVSILLAWEALIETEINLLWMIPKAIKAMVADAGNIFVLLGQVMTGAFTGNMAQVVSAMDQMNSAMIAQGFDFAAELENAISTTWAAVGYAWSDLLFEPFRRGFDETRRGFQDLADAALAGVPEFRPPRFGSGASESPPSTFEFIPQPRGEEGVGLAPGDEEQRRLINEDRMAQEEEFAAFYTGLWGGAYGELLDMGTATVHDLFQSALWEADSWGEATHEIFMNLKQSFTSLMIGMAADWAASKVKMLVAERLFNKQKAAVAIAGATEQAAATAAANAFAQSEQGFAAGAATAKYHQAYAALPFIGQGLAAASVTAMVAQIQATKAAALAFRTGGLIGGSGAGSEDDRLILASSGEYVMQRSAADKYGTAFLDAINRGVYMPQSGGNVSFTFQFNGGSDRDLERQIEDEVVPILERLAAQRRLRLAVA